MRPACLPPSASLQRAPSPTNSPPASPQGLLQWGLADATNTGLPEDALSAILRIIDSTLWAVDPFGSSSDEHLSLLVGHPVVILRARVKLEVQEPIDTTVINTKPVSLRLGAFPSGRTACSAILSTTITRALYCADAAIAGFAREVGPGRGFLQQANLVPDYYQTFSDDIGDTVTEGNSPVNHPYVDSSGPHVHSAKPGGRTDSAGRTALRRSCHLRRGSAQGDRHAPRMGRIRACRHFANVPLRPGTGRSQDAPHARSQRDSRHLELGSSCRHHHLGRGSHRRATQDAHLRPDPASGTEGWMRMMPPPPPGNSKS